MIEEIFDLIRSHPYETLALSGILLVFNGMIMEIPRGYKKIIGNYEEKLNAKNKYSSLAEDLKEI